MNDNGARTAETHHSQSRRANEDVQLFAASHCLRDSDEMMLKEEKAAHGKTAKLVDGTTCLPGNDNQTPRLKMTMSGIRFALL